MTSMAKRRQGRVTRKPRDEQVNIEAVCGAEDAEERWIRALDVLAEYGQDAEHTKGDT